MIHGGGKGPRARRLVDPASLGEPVGYCMSGGKQLHSMKDCPQDSTCVVWAGFAKHPLGARLYLAQQ